MKNYLFALLFFLSAASLQADESVGYRQFRNHSENERCECGCPKPCQCGCTEGHRCHCKQ